MIQLTQICRFELIVFLLGSALCAQAQYTELHNFNNHVEGSNPNDPALLAQGLDGSLYGTLPAVLGFDGSVFSCSPGGAVADLSNFLGKPDGSTPQSGLSLGWDGNFYGTTVRGGTSDSGTVFKYRDGVETRLYSFANGTDGAFPWAPPIQAPDGNIYGATYNGTSPGNAYKINPSTGAFSVIATLPSETTAPFILGTDGNLYGTTQYGGTFNRGTVFQLTTKGKLKIIHSFGGTNDGTIPTGPVLLAADGKLYGTTAGGGAFGVGTVWGGMSTGGAGYKVLHSFQNSGGVTDGETPIAGMVQGSDGFLYSVAQQGGANSLGTLFRINTKGTSFQKLWDFTNAVAGQSGDTPMSTPTLHTNGVIYGTTEHGGTQLPGYGVLYSYNANLKPFAALVVITSGYVNNAVGIIGQGFSTATGVSVGNGPGQLLPISDTAAAVIPLPGALTGPIKVHEPGGDLVTPQTFKVLPAISDFNPKSGPVGTQVTITGTSLTQTTAVTFGGVKANFTVNSDTQVTATVPTGAKTGPIGITTKGGKVTSKGKFTVQ